jgi:hypothetical protein
VKAFLNARKEKPTMGTSSQVTEIARLTAAVDGLQKHYPNGQFTFGGVAFTTLQLVTLFKGAVSDLKATQAARAASKDAVAAARTSMAKARTAYADLIAYIELLNGSQSAMLDDFGKATKARKQPTAETKAAAAQKAKATKASKKPAAAAAATNTTPKS